VNRRSGAARISWWTMERSHWQHQSFYQTYAAILVALPDKRYAGFAGIGGPDQRRLPRWTSM
jgi:hypothetical protein